MTSWEIHGRSFANCNCAYGCPCQFNALPTDGTCEAAVSFIIDQGFHGDVSLDGLMAAFTAKFPGPVHEGNGEQQLIIDERATDDQRAALQSIMTGGDTEEMATMFWVYSAMSPNKHETLFKKLEMEIDIEARKGRILVEDVYEAIGEPIKNPVTGAEHRARIDIPNGFEFRIAEMGSGTTTTMGGDIQLEKNKNSYGQFAEMHLSNSGIVDAAQRGGQLGVAILTDKALLPAILSKQNLVVSLSLAIVILFSGVYTVLGVGMDMNAINMTRMSGVFNTPDAQSTMNMEINGMADMPMSSKQSMDMTSQMSADTEQSEEPVSVSQIPSKDSTLSASETKPHSMSTDAENNNHMSLEMGRGWSLDVAVMMFFMWWFMMVAMMTPSAAPTLLLFHNLKKIGAEKGLALPQTYLFLLGYLGAWAIFSGVACALQSQFEKFGIVNGMMMQLTSVYLSGGLLIAAGLYQFTPLKYACLEKCRAPAEFLAENYRKGASGAFVMGGHHGLFCLGCCWALMALLFVGGVMNLYWIAGLAIYVAIEKLLWKNGWFDKAFGITLVGAGGIIIVT